MNHLFTPFYYVDLGVIKYHKALQLQQALREKRIQGTGSNYLLLLEHPPIITLGRRSHKENLLFSERVYKERGIELQKVDRGGDVTFHGPGQLVGYVISKINEVSESVSEFVSKLGEVLVNVVKGFGVKVVFSHELPGVWTIDPQKKIAAIGLSIKNGVSMHGFALNNTIDLSYFDMIVPCGIKKYGVTSLQREGVVVSMEDLKEKLVQEFAKRFNVQLEEKSLSKVLS